MNRYPDHRELDCQQLSDYLEPVIESRIKSSRLETQGKALPYLSEKLRRPVQYSELNKALRQLPLLESLENSQIDDLAKVGKRIMLNSGELLFRKGDRGDCMYMILAGRIQIFMQSSNGQAAAMLNVLHAGEFFGEMALLDAEERSSSAMTLMPCVLFTLERAPFLNLIAAYPELMTRLLSVLTDRLRRTDERYLVQMAGVPWKER